MSIAPSSPSATRAASGDGSLAHALEQRAALTPSALAYRFFDERAQAAGDITFEAMARAARAIGAMLSTRAGPGDRVLIGCAPGRHFVEAFWGAIHAGVVPVPVPSQTTGAGARRLRAIASDCQPAAAIGSAATLLALSEHPGIIRIETPLPGEPDATDHGARDPRARPPDAIAFLQYTSGSTGAPRGVIVTHANVRHNQQAIQATFKTGAGDRIVSWLPPYHDMGLLGSIVHPIWTGATACLLPPSAFLRHPLSWLETMTRVKGTISGAPDSAYEMCVRRILPSERSGLDLSAWRVAFNGAEPIRAGTIDRFAEAFRRHGFSSAAFFPCYGLAESTLLVSATSVVNGPLSNAFDAAALTAGEARPATPGVQSRTLVHAGCGHAGQTIVIRDPHTSLPCADGRIGEIHVSGPSVTPGYWGSETARTPGDEVALRTGDLGFLSEGRLFITGRLKELIIVRGQNHYPQDIEATVQSAAAWLSHGRGAAFAVDSDTGEAVVVVQEVERNAALPHGDVLRAIRQRVTVEHGIGVHAIVLVARGTIPLTPSGKIQRLACRQLYLDSALTPIASWSAAAVTREETPATPQSPQAWLWSELAAAADVDPSALDARMSAAEIGLDSVSAADLAARAERLYAISLPIGALLSDQPIGALLQQLDDLPRAREAFTTSAPSSLGPGTAREISQGAQGLWFVDRARAEDATYNIARAALVRSPIDAARLRQALQAVVDRHAMLRASFHEKNGIPYCVVHDDVQATVTIDDAGDIGDEAFDELLYRRAMAPFDLRTPPLLRVCLFRRRQEWVLLLTIHHIVADLWSLAILLRELGEAYASAAAGMPVAIAGEAGDYFAVVRREQAMLEGPRGERAWTYWKQQLAGSPGGLDLAPGHLRGTSGTRAGYEVFTFDAALTDDITRFSRARHVTPFVTVLAAYHALLHRYTGTADVATGVPVAGRSSPETRATIGYLVNTLVIRSKVTGSVSFAELLEHVRSTVLGAFDHDAYPFRLLVERLRPERRSDLAPLFRSMFTWHRSDAPGGEAMSALAINREGERLQLGPLTLELRPISEGATNFDLTLAMAMTRDSLSGMFEYRRDVLDSHVVRRMSGHLRQLLAAVIHDPSTRLDDIDLLQADERRTSLTAWNATDAAAPDLCIHTLFEHQVTRTPELPALVAGGQSLTYRELHERVERLAVRLRAAGATPESAVPIISERSADLVVGLLAIMRTGAAYAPIDPDTPAERTRTVIAALQPPCLLASSSAAASLDAAVPIVTVPIVTLPDAAASAGGAAAWRANPDSLAYVIHTSGSTGVPKGVMNSHRAVVNRLQWMQDTHPIGPGDRVLQKTPFTFDVSVPEFFWPLMAGATLVVAPPGAHRDTGELANLIERHAISVIHFVPSMLRAFLADGGHASCRSLRHVFCSGEALPSDLARAARAAFEHATVHNLYGPTEAAVEVTYWNCDDLPATATVPIGLPIRNARAHVLTSSLRPQPAGAIGELYLGGLPVARGYWRRPDLTAASFVPDPFGGSGSRLYRTGDLVIRRPDGSLLFLGRRDHQLKLRGHRIEPGEIEGAIRTHQGALDAVVLLRGEADSQLVAYVVTAGGAALETQALRRTIASLVPEAMVPSRFVWLEALPLSPSGKLDRTALPDPDHLRPELADAYEPPRSAVERHLSNLLASELEIDRVGVHDNLFELGGHSLLVTRVLSEIREVFGVEITLRTVFDTPTVAAVAAAIEARSPGAAGTHAAIPSTSS